MWMAYEPPHNKTNKMACAPRQTKTQISQGIRPVWSASSLSACRKLGSLATHWAHSEDSDQTGCMPRLIWVFAGRTVILFVLSWDGSYLSETLDTDNERPIIQFYGNGLPFIPINDSANMCTRFPSIAIFCIVISAQISKFSTGEVIFEPRHDKTCLREFPTRPDTNRPEQPQKLAWVLKFWL